MKPCLNCDRPFDEVRFPLARPRKDGTRHPFRYCDSCLALPRRHGGGMVAKLRGSREHMARVRLAERRARQRVAA